MTEATVVNLAVTLRVLIIGGILLILPRVTRRGLLFGVYVGEDFAASEPGRQLLRSWTLGCFGVMALALAVAYGISLAGWPLAGNFIGTAVLLLAALALYVRTYGTTRRLAPHRAARQAHMTAASLAARDPTAARLAAIALAICVLASLATAAYAALAYAAMPQRVPVLSSLTTVTMADKSPFAVLFAPAVNLVVSPMYALLGLLTAQAKRSVRGGSGGRSVEAQDAFRTFNALVFSVTALLVCAMLTVLSVQLVRVGLSETTSLGLAVWWLAGALLLVLVASLGRMITRYGQGGALRERASTDAPLTGGLADDSRWVLGMFYVDRHDPSIMVEKRFGLGYSLNYGNRTAVAIVVTFFGLLIALAAFALVATQ